MKKPEASFLADFLSKRTSFLELVLTAFCAAFGINFMSGSLPTLIPLGNPFFFGIGLFLCVVPLAYYLYQAFRERSEVQHYEGFLVFDTQTKEVISVSGYRFLESASRELEKAIHTSRSNSISTWKRVDLESDADNRDTIIKDLTEYYVLTVLSDCLKQHFRSTGRPRHQSISSIHTTSLSEIQSNIFVESNIDSADNFNLILPKGSKVRMTEQMQGILIQMAGCRIEINDSIFKSAPYLSIRSKIKYLVDTPEDRLSCFKVEIPIKVTYKTGVMFLFGASLYRYQWIQTFLDELHIGLSEEAFFESINWSYSTQVVLSKLLGSP